MTRAARLGLFVLGFMTATGIEAARAQEAYLCEGGRIVKVPYGRLEEFKRTDPCVAAYHGVKIDTAAQIETGAIAPPASTEREPVTQQAAIAIPANPIPASNLSTSASVKPAPVRQAALAERPGPPRASEATDYRNVVLLNPEPGQSAIFRHER